MCIALVKKAGAFISNEHLKNSFDNNDDGCGMAWIDENHEIQIFKTLDFKEFMAKYAEVELTYGEMSDMLIHFRIKTHGKVDIDNCHPFRINEDAVFIHNGTITDIPTEKDRSDTRIFNEVVLQQLPAGWEQCSGTKRLIEKFIGWSKICVLNRNTGIHIYNESKGEWVDNVWYSNNSYKRAAITIYSSSNSSDYYNNASARGYGEVGDFKIKLPVTEVTTKALVPKEKAVVYEKCSCCAQYENVELMFIDSDKADTKEYYCIDCVEYVYSPDDIVSIDGKEIAFYDYLIECGDYTDKEVEAYIDRHTELLSQIAVAYDLKLTDTDKEEEDEESQTAAI